MSADHRPGRGLSTQGSRARYAGVSDPMDRHTPERFANFDARIRAIPQVLECLLITGQDADYQLKVVVRDMQAYPIRWIGIRRSDLPTSMPGFAPFRRFLNVC